MDQVINDLVHLLRRNGPRIWPAESIDGLQALRAVGLGERQAVRDSLRATLVKNAEDIKTFERLFADYFGLRELHQAQQRYLRVPTVVSRTARPGADSEMQGLACSATEITNGIGLRSPSA